MLPPGILSGKFAWTQSYKCHLPVHTVFESIAWQPGPGFRQGSLQHLGFPLWYPQVSVYEVLNSLATSGSWRIAPLLAKTMHLKHFSVNTGQHMWAGSGHLWKTLA